MKPTDLIDLHHFGYDRYNTVAVRYIEWFCHIQRIMRQLMADKLTWVSDKVVHNLDVLDKSITENESNKPLALNEFD